MNLNRREVENYELTLTGEQNSPSEKLFLTFAVDDLPGMPMGATAVFVDVDPSGVGNIVISFEDSSKMEDVSFPDCPAPLVETLRRFEWLGVVGLPDDGEKVKFFSSVRVSVSSSK